MSTAQKLLDGALALPREERVALIDALSESVEQSRDELGPGWNEEIARRIGALERGETKLVEGDEVSARVRTTLRNLTR